MGSGGPRFSKAERKAAKKHKDASPVDGEATEPEEQCTKPVAAADAEIPMSRRGKKQKRSRESLLKVATAGEPANSAKRMRIDAQAPHKKLHQAPEMSLEVYRSKHGITVAGSGQDVAPAQTFDAMEDDFGTRLINALCARGYREPTPIQAQGWPLVLQGRDVIGVASTGSGKTCAFVLPVLARMASRKAQSPMRKPVDFSVASGDDKWTCSFCNNVNWPQRIVCNTRTCKAPRPDTPSASACSSSRGRPAAPSALIVAPTRELGQQIHVETCKFTQPAAGGARAVCIFGGVPKGDQAGILLSSGADMVIATPGRCLDFLKADSLLGIPLCLKKVTYLVLDEADRMLEAGFLPDIQEIIAGCPASTGASGPQTGGAAGGPKANTRRQTLFFTATWPKTIQEAARSIVSLSATEVRVAQRSCGELSANKAVAQRIEVLEAHGAKLERLMHVLGRELRSGTCLIFGKTKKRCDWLAKKVLDAAQQTQVSWVRALHSDKSQKERDETLQSFRALTAADGRQKGVLVATNVASRGLDIPGVSLVIVYDFDTVDDYVHQIGRTARAGATGHAVVFYVSGDGGARELAGILRQAGQDVPLALAKIAAQEPEKGLAAVDIDVNCAKARHGWKKKKWSKNRSNGEASSGLEEGARRPKKHVKVRRGVER